MVEPEALRVAIEASWGVDTSFVADEWSIENPARGQCVVTALVVQQYLGGELQKYDTIYNGQDESHYCNLLPDGREVDWSRQQYPSEQVLVPSTVNLHVYSSVRDKMMHEPETVRKYELLLGRVVARLDT